VNRHDQPRIPPSPDVPIYTAAEVRADLVARLPRDGIACRVCVGKGEVHVPIAGITVIIDCPHCDGGWDEDEHTEGFDAA
jgi:hypothetical protein